MLPALIFPVRTGLLLALAAVASTQSLPARAQPTGSSPAAATTSAPATTPAAATTPIAADPHRKQDVMRHRAMASAHEAAARCLETGERESVCQERLRKACDGIAIGRYCGMKHGH